MDTHSQTAKMFKLMLILAETTNAFECGLENKSKINTVNIMILISTANNFSKLAKQQKLFLPLAITDPSHKG